MISYVLLHINRPFLLDLNVKLIRKYFPKNTQIIVADDGSTPDVIKKIKKFEIDDLFISDNNINTQHKGSCSSILLKSRNSCKGEYYLFSEDDFFYNPNPILWHGKGNPNDGDYMPKIYFPNNIKFSPIDEAIEILQSKKDIKQIQMARDATYNPLIKLTGEIKTNNIKWHYMDRSKIKKYYYCNWPHLMRFEDLKKCPIPEGLSITGVENEQGHSFDSVFGINNNWSILPLPPHYIHVARGLSNRFSITRGGRVTVNESMQSNLFGKIKYGYHEFKEMLSLKYVEGKFVVDFEEMINKGLNEAFTSAFERLSKHVKGI